MRALAFLLAVSFTAYTAPQSARAQLAPDFDRLQGMWIGEGPGGPCTLTISGDSLFYTHPAADETKEDFFYETTFVGRSKRVNQRCFHDSVVRNVRTSDARPFRT